MMSVKMKKAHTVADEYDKKLKANDPRFQGIVVVQSKNDASSFTFSEAFALYYEEFCLVFTEHYGLHLYHKEDAYVVTYSKREVIKKLRIKNEKKQKD